MKLLTTCPGLGCWVNQNEVVTSVGTYIQSQYLSRFIDWYLISFPASFNQIRLVTAVCYKPAIKFFESLYVPNPKVIYAFFFRLWIENTICWTLVFFCPTPNGPVALIPRLWMITGRFEGVRATRLSRRVRKQVDCLPCHFKKWQLPTFPHDFRRQLVASASDELKVVVQSTWWKWQQSILSLSLDAACT